MPPQPFILKMLLGRAAYASWGHGAGGTDPGLDPPALRIKLFERLGGAHEGHFSLVEEAMTFGLTGMNGFAAMAFAATVDITGSLQVSGLPLSWRPRDARLEPSRQAPPFASLEGERRGGSMAPFRKR